MIRWILGIAGILAALAAMAAGVGVAIPRDHVATSWIDLRQPPQAVWAAIRNPATLVGTWPDLTSARRVMEGRHREIWEQEAGGFAMRFIVAESKPTTRLVTLMDVPADASFGGQWIYELEPMGTGTRVTITEEGWVAHPIVRVLMHLGGVHRTIDGYLVALGTHFGETVQPDHLP